MNVHTSPSARRFVYLVVFAGTCVSAATFAFGAVDAFALLVVAWGVAPYACLLASLRLLPSLRGPAVLAAVTLACDVVMRWGFFFPSRSTSALILLWAPFWLLFAVMPLTVFALRFVAWLQSRSSRAG